jgi:hypothetical protein
MGKERKLPQARSDKFTWILSAMSIASSPKKALTQDSGAKANQQSTTTTLTHWTKSHRSLISFQTLPNQHTTTHNMQYRRQTTSPRRLSSPISKMATIQSLKPENCIATFIKMSKLFTTVWNVNYWFALNVRFMVSTRIITYIRSKRLLLSSKKPFIL